MFGIVSWRTRASRELRPQVAILLASTPPMSAAPDVTDDDLPRPFGSYLLLQNFARGGMGDVYLAKSGGIAGLERVCVLKKLRGELTRDREYVTRFIDEARVVVTLNHANICNVFDVGRVDSEYYLAMEYVSGRDVRAFQERCRKTEVMPPPLASLYITCEVLEALDYAHRRHHPVTQEPLHLVHRDISPQNVLVSYEGEVKLIDFGLAASRLKVERTQPNVVMGKMAYMPPEQARGDPIDSRADLFACGVLAYELLTNERYYEGMSATDIWQVAGRGGFMPRAWGSIEPALATILARALHPEARRRFPTCGDFRDALHSYMRERLPGNPARIVRQLMEQLFEDELAREKAALARFGAVTVASVSSSVEHTKSQSVSLAGGGAQRTDETSGSHAGRMPPPTLSRSTEEGSPMPTSPPGMHDDPTRIDQERPLASSTKAQTEPSHDRVEKPAAAMGTRTEAPQNAHLDVPGTIPTNAPATWQGGNPGGGGPVRTPGPQPAASPTSAAPRGRPARPAGSPSTTPPRSSSALPGVPMTTGAALRGNNIPAAPVSTGAPAPRGSALPASPVTTGSALRGGSLPAAPVTTGAPRGSGQPAAPVTSAQPVEDGARVPHGAPPAASPNTAAGRSRARGAPAEEGTQRIPRRRKRAETHALDEDDDATVRHRTDDDDEDATVRHRTDDDDATMRHRTDEDTDRTSLDTARAGARWRFWALGAAVVVAVVVALALARGDPGAVPTPDATNSTNSANATSATTAGHVAPTPAVTNPVDPGAAPSTTTDAPSATNETPRRSTTPGASTASAQPKTSPTTTPAQVPPAPTSGPPALNTTAVALLWKKLEARAPGEPCVLSLITRVKFENEPFEKAGADIQRCARTLGIKP
jgi:serine/threonine-protein kinase